MKNPIFLNSIKYLLTTLAVINLILLFGFHYEIPTAIKDKFFKEKTQESYFSTEEKEAAGELTDAVNFRLEMDTLNYDGTESLNLLEGVTVVDKKGNPLELTVYSSIKGTDDQTKKIVTYTAKDEEGNSASIERNLILNNYYGPALTIGTPYPVIYDTTLKNIPQTFKESGILSANDGYGKNITDSIQCSYEVSNDGATEVTVTCSVTNHFDDTVTEKVTIPLTRTQPLILLKESSIKIKQGESFDALSYVKSATNEQSENLTHLIRTEGVVDTNTAGTYEITYKLTDRDLERADDVVLSVTVEE